MAFHYTDISVTAFSEAGVFGMNGAVSPDFGGGAKFVMYFDDFNNSSTETIKLNGNKINFPDLVITSQTQANLNQLKNDFEERLNALLATHDQLVDTLNTRSSLCYQITDTQYGYDNCMNEYGQVTAYNQNLADIAEWDEDFKSDIAELARSMIANCIPCDQIRDFIIEQFGDVLLPGFVGACEEEAEEMKIVTDCCILVCCDPCHYKLG